jgi:hypothetical protein
MFNADEVPLISVIETAAGTVLCKAGCDNFTFMVGLIAVPYNILLKRISLNEMFCTSTFSGTEGGGGSGAGVLSLLLQATIMLQQIST